jgi:acyl-CoA thioester hydrolase
MSDEFPAPIVSFESDVLPNWLDHNHHLNSGYYGVAFDEAMGGIVNAVGLGREYRARTPYGFFIVENHTVFMRELRAEARLRITSQLIGWDSKRVHCFHEMRHAREGFVAATQECLFLHVDRTLRRAVEMPSEALAILERLWRSHSRLPQPTALGRVMAVKPR